jgi:uncharacterized SAM-binding protein YcdF (DUF218 family)
MLFCKLFSALDHSACFRMIMLAVSVLGLVFFALPLSAHILNVGNEFGLAFSGCLMICVLFHKKLNTLTETIISHKAGRITLGIFSAFLLLCILLCMILSAMMLHAAHKKPDTAPKAMIVLGCKVRGTVPSLMLSRRIQAAYQAMQTYPEMIVIASGGQGSDEDISEAQCICDSLVQMGADKERILMENRSTTTAENMEFSKDILEKKGIAPDSVILIASDGYHELRAQMLAGYQGVTNCYPASAATSWFLLPTYFVREWFGIAHAFVFHS